MSPTLLGGELRIPHRVEESSGVAGCVSAPVRRVALARPTLCGSERPSADSLTSHSSQDEW